MMIKNLKQSTLKFAALSLFVAMFSCSSDDDAAPVNEEEVITTVTVLLTPEGGGSAIILKSFDSDGNGSTAPELSVSGNLSANTTYNGSITLLNELESPAGNITEEVEQEANEHQFFYTLPSALGTVNYVDNDVDANGNPLGLFFTLKTLNAGQGVFSATLIHEPKKPNNGTTADAGGETDVAVSFNVTVE